VSETASYPLQEIASQFQVRGDFIEALAFGHGHINDTYLARYRSPADEHRYILQRINHAVFKEPEKVIENIERVTRYAREYVRAQGGDPDQRVLTLVAAQDGRFFHRDEAGNTWRVYHYVEGTSMFEANPSLHVLYSAAKAFGEFQRILADLPGERLHETIPNFHHTRKRFETFQQILSQDPVNRAVQVKSEIDFILKREADASVVVDLLAQNRLPERVTHNDTKINNVLIDDKSGEGLCVIDLDTVMPGSALYDFGDMVRAGAAASAEDEPLTSRAGLNIDRFIQLARGYSDAVRDMLTQAEWELLAFSAKLITFEQAIRFLGDYIHGDTYYKIQRPGQNLDRARTQIKMVAEMEEKMGLMEAVVERCRLGKQK
jgi:aminoglycoside phosphotransferase (APT) family kinase protein